MIIKINNEPAGRGSRKCGKTKGEGGKTKDEGFRPLHRNSGPGAFCPGRNPDWPLPRGSYPTRKVRETKRTVGTSWDRCRGVMKVDPRREVSSPPVLDPR